MVSIVTDSTVDLSPELVERYRINVIPYIVHHGKRTFHDGIDMDAEGIYQLVEATGELPKTAAPPVADYIQAFDRSDDIIFTGIASALSAGFQNATLAAQEFPPGKVHLIDSRNITTGTGLLVLRAAELRDRGATAGEIESELQAAVPRLRTSMVLDTLKYVYMGGRCSGVESFVGSLLRIRPVIYVLPDGSLGVREKVRGTRRHALQRLVDDFAAHLPEIDLARVFLTHAGSDPEDLQFVADEVRRLGSPKELPVTRAGCTISCHCGPNTTGIMYMVK
jgi:fatty acid kinase fatty acid binding subunit